MKTLYLSSKSASRRMLLDQARISYQVAVQDADESKCDWGQTLPEVTKAIALYKMEQTILPAGKNDGQICFVLTADTLSEDSKGAISGKPVDEADAIEKIMTARAGMRTGTAFCLDRKIWRNDKWIVDKRIEQFVDAHYEFNVPDNWIEHYMKNVASLQATQAIAIEEYGAQFVRVINGSYTAIVGLPIYEVRVALEVLGFFN